jgi:hypothetical protein
MLPGDSRFRRAFGVTATAARLRIVFVERALVAAIIAPGWRGAIATGVRAFYCLFLHLLRLRVRAFYLSNNELQCQCHKRDENRFTVFVTNGISLAVKKCLKSRAVN